MNNPKPAMKELSAMMVESNERGNVLRSLSGRDVVCMSVRQRRNGKLSISYRWRLDNKAASLKSVCEAIGA